MTETAYYFEKLQKIANKYDLELGIIGDIFAFKSTIPERPFLHDIIFVDHQMKWDSIVEIFDDLCRYIASTIELKYNYDNINFQPKIIANKLAIDRGELIPDWAKF